MSGSDAESETSVRARSEAWSEVDGQEVFEVDQTRTQAGSYMDSLVSGSDSDLEISHRPSPARTEDHVADSEEEATAAFALPTPAAKKPLPRTTVTLPPRRGRLSPSPIVSGSGVRLDEEHLTMQSEVQSRERQRLKQNIKKRQEWVYFLKAHANTPASSEILLNAVLPQYKKLRAQLAKMPAPYGESDAGLDLGEDILDHSELSTGATSSQFLPESTPSVFSRESTPEAVVAQPEWLEILREDFHLNDFRDKQLDAVAATLSGRDVFVNVHTGGGKSLIYQLAALLEHRQRGAVTFVIGPLRSLKADQMAKCRDLGIESASIDGDTSWPDRGDILARLLTRGQPDLCLFFITPEMFISNAIQQVARSLSQRGLLGRFVIDEVHTVMTHKNFRDAFKSLGDIKVNFPGVPILGLTATASRKAIKSIVAQLKMDDPKIVCDDLDRPNLFYEIREAASEPIHRWTELAEFIEGQSNGAPGIVYFGSQKDAERATLMLAERGHKAVAYHAGLDPALREQNQARWLAGKEDIVCATIAFSMGIDRPDCRFVVHNTLPKSMEAYFQETGRAGRDGKPASCLALYSDKSKNRQRQQINEDFRLSPEERQEECDALQIFMNFCQDRSTCRRQLAADYFGSRPPAMSSCQQCDICVPTEGGDKLACHNCYTQAVEFLEVLQDVSDHVLEDITPRQAMLIALGSSEKIVLEKGWDQLQTYGTLWYFKLLNLRRLHNYLLMRGAVREVSKSSAQSRTATYVRLGPNAGAFFNGAVTTARVWVSPVKNRSKAKRTKKSKRRHGAPDNKADRRKRHPDGRFKSRSIDDEDASDGDYSGNGEAASDEEVRESYSRPSKAAASRLIKTHSTLPHLPPPEYLDGERSRMCHAPETARPVAPTINSILHVRVTKPAPDDESASEEDDPEDSLDEEDSESEEEEEANGQAFGSGFEGEDPVEITREGKQSSRPSPNHPPSPQRATRHNSSNFTTPGLRRITVLTLDSDSDDEDDVDPELRKSPQRAQPVTALKRHRSATPSDSPSPSSSGDSDTSPTPNKRTRRAAPVDFDDSDSDA